MVDKVIDGPAIKPKFSGEVLFIGPARENSFASSVSRAADRIALPPQALIVTVRNRLNLKRAAIRRGRTGFGRLLNRLTGDDPNYVEFSGSELSRLLQACGQEIEAKLAVGTLYLVRYDVVEAWSAALNATREPD